MKVLKKSIVKGKTYKLHSIKGEQAGCELLCCGRNGRCIWRFDRPEGLNDIIDFQVPQWHPYIAALLGQSVIVTTPDNTFYIDPRNGQLQRDELRNNH